MPTEEHNNPRLLAIDDSVLIHRLLKARLKHERLEIHSAISGHQGLTMAKSLLPDVILLDLDMEDIDGFQVLLQLKEEPATHDIPVIFLSGVSGTTDRVRGIDMGAIDFISKPFDIAELKARVRSAIRMRHLIKMLARRAQVDGLTGLWNRAYFDDRLHSEMTSAERYQRPLSLILCDVDKFKNLNDTYGHPFGDRVLEELAIVLEQGREGDVPCRYGGEEFAIILPNITAEEAAHVADRHREALAARQWHGHPDLVVTASFGVVDLERVAETNPEAIIASADAALYAAKENGRNRVELASLKNAPARLSA